MEIPFLLSWTHYIQLLKIKDDDERNFYEIEASANDWSVRELQRQYNAAFDQLVGKEKWIPCRYRPEIYYERLMCKLHFLYAKITYFCI